MFGIGRDNFAVFTLGILALFFSAFCQAEQIVTNQSDYKTVISTLSDYISDVVDDEDIPGLSVALLDGNQLVWSDGFGYADVENKIKATAQTVYRQGAVSTTLTAFAIMQLVQQNKVKLDAPLTDYLPEFTMVMPEGQLLGAITIRRLLTHHAGLPISLFEGMWSERPETLQQLLPRLREVAASYPVDQIYAYSNLGYDLLGRVIEVVSGQSFADYMQQHILTPLAMNSSGFVLSEKWQKNVAAEYKKDQRKTSLSTRDLPAIGLYASVEDLALFVAQLIHQGNTELLADQWRQQMISPQNREVALDLRKHVGFAWQINPFSVAPEYQEVWRQGASLTHRSRIAFLPEVNIAVIISANSSRAFRGVEQISDEALRLMLQAKGGKLPAQTSSSLSPPPGQRDDFAAAYAGYLGLLEVVKDGQNYRLDLLGWGFELIPRGDGWYRLQYELFGFIPLKFDWLAKVSVAPVRLDGRRVAVINYKGVNTLFAEEISPIKPNDVWLARLGRYAPAEMDALLAHYEVDEGKLRFDHGYYFFEYRLPYWVPLRFRLPMEPVSENEMRVAGLGTALGERVRFIGADRAWYSGYELKRVAKP